MKTRIIEAIVSRLNKRDQVVVVLEVYSDFGVIDRKVVRWDGEAVNDTHEQSSYSQKRREQKARSARQSYHLRKYAA